MSAKKLALVLALPALVALLAGILFACSESPTSLAVRTFERAQGRSRRPRRADDPVGVSMTESSTLGSLWASPPLKNESAFTVYTRNRFEGQRMAERWDRADFAGLLAQLRD